MNPQFALEGNTDFAPWVTPYSMGTLAAGESRSIVIRGLVDPSADGGILVNSATVTSDTPDPDTGNNTDQADTEILVSADVSVSKSAGAQTAVPGQAFHYTLAVANAGPSDARDVTLVDALPASVLNPQFSTDGGATYRPWSSPYQVGLLQAGERRDIVIRGMLSASPPAPG